MSSNVCNNLYMETSVKAETLMDMHKEANLTLRAGASKMAELLAHKDYTHTSYEYLIETGTKDIDKIEALGLLFGRTAQDVRSAATESLRLHRVAQNNSRTT